MRSYDGGWQEYVRVREEKRTAARSPKAKGAAAAKADRAAGPQRRAAKDRAVAPQRGGAKADRAATPSKAQAKAKHKAKPASAPGCASERMAAATAAQLARAGNGNGDEQMLSKNARRRIRDLEHQIEQAEDALKALEAELADPAAWATPERSAQSSERHASAKRAVEEAFSRWEAAAS